MKIIETSKYRTLKYIVIGLLMTIDLFVLYILIRMFENSSHGQSNIYDFLLVTYIFISIPFLLILSFKSIVFEGENIKINYLFGLVRLKRSINELKIHQADNDRTLRIVSLTKNNIVNIYKENISNYKEVERYLGDRILKSEVTIQSKLKFLLITWITIGLTLYLLTRLD